MLAITRTPLTAAAVKAKARELGASLVGIADGAALEMHPPDPADPRRPSDITELDGGRIGLVGSLCVLVDPNATQPWPKCSKRRALTSINTKTRWCLQRMKS